MRPKLLIAQSDDSLREACQQFFTDSGFDVETAPDGVTCVRKLRQQLPELLVLDTDMNWGGADGVLDHLHEEHPQHDIPVILTRMTKYPKDFTSRIKLPVVANVPEPFGLTNLLERVDDALVDKQQNRLPYRNRASDHSELFVG